MTATQKKQAIDQRNARLRFEYLAAEATLQDSEPGSRAAVRAKRLMERTANEFVQANDALAYEASKTFMAGNSSDVADDLQSAARLALWEAFLSWNPEKGSFSTWSRLFREGAARRQAGHLLYPGISYDDFVQRPEIIAAVDEAGAGASVEDIAQIAGVSEGLVERVLLANRSVRSLDAPILSESGDARSVSDTLADEVSEPEEDHREYVAAALEVLSPLELWIFVRANGLDGAIPQQGKHIAAGLGYHRDAVNRVRREADAKVTAVLTGQPLHDEHEEAQPALL